MKNLKIITILFTIFLLLTGYSRPTIAQVCQGNITLSSQAEVDAFSCTEINGSLVISGNDITNLNTLSSLMIVHGNLSISDNPNLEIVDLPALEINQGSLSISGNANLNSITGFNNTSQAISIHIGGNPKLGSISGFNSLAHVDGLGVGGLTIVQNDALTSLPGFDALITTPNLRIVNNPKLVALDGFPSLTQVIGDFEISNNESLKEINGFNNLRGISGYPRIVLNSGLLIQNNASLETLAGLSSLKSISAPLDGGRVPPVPGTVTVYVTGNPKLTECCSLRPLLDALVAGGGPSPFVRINISGNGGSCTYDEILNCEKICDGDVTLTSQAEVDAFNCTKVTGNLTVTGADITNISGLSSLREVQGSLSISGNANLSSISGFNNLLHASLISIGGNPKLGGISGFNSLASVLEEFGRATFIIGQNDALTNIQGFGALGTTTNLRIVNNAKLLALDGFPSLTHVIGDFEISNNESLKTINGFSKLRGISGYPRVYPNAGLLIENNASLETLAGLSSLKSISAPIQAWPPAPGTVTVYVTGNPKLTECCTLGPLLDALVPSPFVRINISGNGGGCSYEDILNCEKICEGDVTLTSQAQVDAFNCTKVTGNLTVTGADITNLHGLSSLREVYGDLRIENTNATSLEGLLLLDSIGKALLVMNNPSLTGVGLSCSVQEGIEISYNNNLLQVSGFNTVKKLFWLGIQNNPNLTSVEGFNSVETIQTASPSPFAPTGIGISNNGALAGIPGFQMLSRVGQITITGNNQLSSLDGFSNVSWIVGVLTISDNSSLKVINAFSKLVSIVGISREIPSAGLLIENNPVLEGFPGLSSLKEVTSDQWAEISIHNNASLKNIDGLSSLTTFFTLHSDKTLNIRNNAVLENVDGLSSLVNLPQGEGDTYINVTGNAKLTRCCGLKPLLDAISYYDPLSLHIDISQNGGGCTLQDILACGLQKVLNFTLINYKTHEVIQNFQDEITIDLADPKFSYLLLQANTVPQQVGSVEFIFDGRSSRIENQFPYEFTLPQLTPGTHTVRADVYSKHQKKGEKGIGRTATFKVINSAAIISFDVVNRFGQILMNLHDGDKININDPAFKHFRFRANAVPDQVGRVDLYLNNRLVAVEYHFPYEVYGNPTPGDYTLEAIPYVKTTGRHAVAGTPLKISFKVVSENTISPSQLAVNDQQNAESFRQASESAGVLIFPVPVDNELFVKMDDTAGKDAVLNILTIQGLSVYKGTYSKSSSISTADLKPGVYVLHVVGNNGFHKVVKFIKK